MCKIRMWSRSFVLSMVCGAGAIEAQLANTVTPTGPDEAPLASAITIDDEVTRNWNTPTSTSDCVAGWVNDRWELILTGPREVTVSIADCCWGP